MSLGPTGDEYVIELLSKERAWLVVSSKRHRGGENPQDALRKVNSISNYLRNGGPKNLVPQQAQDVIDALDHAYLITPVANPEEQATWEPAVAQARAGLVPYALPPAARAPSNTYKFKRG